MFAVTKSADANLVSIPPTANFNVGTSVGVPNSAYDINNEYTITIDANTVIANGRTVGLNDIVILGVCRYGGTGLYDITTTDFTQLYFDESTSTFEVGIYYAIFTGSQLTLTISRFSAGSNQPFLYQLLAIRYPDSTTPIDVSINVEGFSEINTTGSATTEVIDASSLTTTTNNAVVINGILLGGKGDSGLGISPVTFSSFLDTPSNMSLAASELDFSTTGSDSNPYITYSAAAYAKVATAGAFNPATWGTVTVQPDQSVFGISYTIAIKSS